MLELLLKPREVRGGHLGGLRCSRARGCDGMRGGGRGRGCAVERALSRRDFGNDLIDAEFGRLRLWLGRRARGRRVRSRMARAHLFEPCVEFGDRVGQPRAARGDRCCFGFGRVTKSLRELAEAGAERAGGLRAHAGDRRIAKGRAQPILNRHSGALRGFTRGLIKLRAEAAGIPRCA